MKSEHKFPDLTDPLVLERGVPHDVFARLRQAGSAQWIEQPHEDRIGMLDAAGGGYWAISTHADVAAVSRNSKDFSAAENSAVIRYNGPYASRETVEMSRVMLLNQDEPDHAALRSIISRGFTSRAITVLDETMAERTHRIVTEAIAVGDGDFVTQIAAELPLQVIADLLGVPQEDRGKLFDWSNQMQVDADPEVEGDQQQAAAEIVMYAMALAAERKEAPRDDIITTLINAGEGGRGLADDEFAYFVMLLVVAGNETTRHALTHGMNAFFEFPDQWELWKATRPSTMVDEVLRWATPVTVFQRTAVRDVQIGRANIQAGQRVGLFYASANFDESVFTNPHAFNISRNPNPHVAFGGHGAHYCIGANLARLEIKSVFDCLADLAPDIRKVAEPRRLRHSWINGVKELQVAYS